MAGTPDECRSGAWSPKSNDKTQWLQLQLLKPEWIVGVATQGPKEMKGRQASNWVSSFYVYYSLDGESFRPYALRRQLRPYKFPANTDKSTPVEHYFDRAVRARYLRINPASWNERIALRMEVFVCTAKSTPCSIGNGGCDTNVHCIVPDANKWERICTPCPNGYTGTGDTLCQDVDECLVGNGGCDPRTECTNTPGSRICAPCPEGFTGSGEDRGGCQDIDECLKNNGGCDVLTSCLNRAGGFTCTQCPPGYTGNGATGCVDVNECEVNNGGCDALTECTNTPGGVTCGACPHGFEGTGKSGCVDIDECLVNNGGCDTTCTNYPGKRVCAPCPEGYLGTPETKCYSKEDAMYKDENGKAITNEELARLAGARAAAMTAEGLERDLVAREKRQAARRQELADEDALEQQAARLQDLSYAAQAAHDNRIATNQRLTQVNQDVVTEASRIRAQDLLTQTTRDVNQAYVDNFGRHADVVDGLDERVQDGARPSKGKLQAPVEA